MGPANSKDEGSASEGTSSGIKLPLQTNSHLCCTFFVGSSNRCDSSRVDVRPSLLRLSPPRSTPPHLQQPSTRRNLVGRSSSVPTSVQLSPHFLCVRLLLSSAFILRFVTDHRLDLVRRSLPFPPPTCCATSSRLLSRSACSSHEVSPLSKRSRTTERDVFHFKTGGGAELTRRAEDVEGTGTDARPG